MPIIDEIVTFLRAVDSFYLFASTSDRIIRRPAPISEAVKGEVAFCGITARNPQVLLANTHASLLILDRDLPFDVDLLTAAGVEAIIQRDNARLDFMRVVERFFSPPHPRGIHPSAVIGAGAQIASNVFIGPLCSIGEAEVGEGTAIHAGVHIYDGVRIGRNVIIHSGTVIGADGFGYQRNEEGELEKFPHIGGVVIEDDVEIGANTCIDRGTLGDTVICQGARIDNLVHIAHNVVVGKHAAVIADAMIGGGTRIGDYAWIAPSACLRDRISIGAKATVGLAALVTKNVPEGITVLGAPARELSEQRRLLKSWASIVSQDDKG